MRKASKLLPLLALCFGILPSLLFSQNTPSESLAIRQNISLAFAGSSVEWNPLKTYDSLEAQIYTAIYEGLVTYNPQTLRPEPGVAKSWLISRDQTVYTFSLRSDAKFSDGTAINASVVQNTLLEILNPEREAPFAALLDPIKGASAYRSGKNKNPSSVSIAVKDSLTLEITLERPSAWFIQVLCHQSMVVIHPSLLKKPDWTEKTVIGNGPFVLKSLEKNVYTFLPSETYWDRKNVKAESLTITITDDDPELTERYNEGEIHWIDSIVDFSRLAKPADLTITPQFHTQMLYFSNHEKAYANEKVRRALALLIPYTELRDKDRYLVPTSRLVPEIPTYPSPRSISEKNETEALKLLEEAGFPKGKGLPTMKLRFPDSEYYAEIVDLLKKAWSVLEFKIDSTPTQDVFAYELDASEYTVTILSWIGDYADPMTFLELWVSSSSLNKSRFNDPEFDKLIRESNELSGVARYRLLSQAEERLLSTAQVIPISHSPAYNVVDLQRVGGWFENPLNIHPLKYLFLKAQMPPRNVASFDLRQHYRL